MNQSRATALAGNGGDGCPDNGRRPWQKLRLGFLWRGLGSVPRSLHPTGPRGEKSFIVQYLTMHDAGLNRVNVH